MKNNNQCFLNTTKNCFIENDINILIQLFNKHIDGKICNTSSKKCLNKKFKKIDENLTEKDKLKELQRQLKPIIKKISDIPNLSFLEYLKNNNLKLYIKFKYLLFKPEKPKQKWLADGDINKVMFQYNNKYNDLYFYGAVPCNFYKLNKINYQKFFTKKWSSIIINTQKYGQYGEHWTCLFIDNKNKNIEFYDSLGNNPNKYIIEFLDILYKISNYNIFINKIKHQKLNSQCGVFSMYYILQRLNNKSMYDILYSNINDKKMEKIRKKLYLS